MYSDSKKEEYLQDLPNVVFFPDYNTGVKERPVQKPEKEEQQAPAYYINPSNVKFCGPDQYINEHDFYENDHVIEDLDRRKEEFLDYIYADAGRFFDLLNNTGDLVRYWPNFPPNCPLGKGLTTSTPILNEYVNNVLTVFNDIEFTTKKDLSRLRSKAFEDPEYAKFFEESFKNFVFSFNNGKPYPYINTDKPLPSSTDPTTSGRFGFEYTAQGHNITGGYQTRVQNASVIPNSIIDADDPLYSGPVYRRVKREAGSNSPSPVRNHTPNRNQDNQNQANQNPLRILDTKSPLRNLQQNVLHTLSIILKTLAVTDNIIFVNLLTPECREIMTRCLDTVTRVTRAKAEEIHKRAQIDKNRRKREKREKYLKASSKLKYEANDKKEESSSKKPDNGGNQEFPPGISGSIGPSWYATYEPDTNRQGVKIESTVSSKTEKPSQENDYESEKMRLELRQQLEQSRSDPVQ